MDFDLSVEMKDEVMSAIKTDDKGKKWLNLKLKERQQPDDYGNTHYLLLAKKKGEEKTYCGRGKTIAYGDNSTGGQTSQSNQQQATSYSSPSQNEGQYNSPAADDSDDLPF